MGVNNSPFAFEDVRDAFDRALASEKGVRIYETSLGRLVNLKIRLHRARALDRKLSKDQYEEGDPRRGTSPYDAISIHSSPAANAKKREDGTYPAFTDGELYLELVKNEPGRLRMEEI